MRLATLLLLAIVLFSQCHNASTTHTEELTIINDSLQMVQTLDSMVSVYDTAQAFNGIIGIVQKGHKPVIFIKGYKNPVTKKEPLEPSDLFNLASVTKQFTGMALLQLMKKHNIQPTDTIGQWFPELKPALQKVTIQQMANHRAAIHDYFSLTSNYQGITNQDVLELLSELDTTALPPGVSYGYSNSHYVLMAIMVERISGQTFETYLNDNVIQPLKMYHTNFQPSKKHLLDGYYGDSANSVFPATIGGGYLHTNALDMITYSQNKALFDPLYQMAEEYATSWKNPEWQYGFGWYFYADDLGPYRAHSGQGHGFQSYVRHNSKGDFSFFILTNHHGPLINPLRDATAYLGYIR